MSYIRIGHIVIDGNVNSVSVNGIEAKLTDSEYKLLRCLAENCGEFLDRDIIFQEVWSTFGPWPENKILDVMICRIRKKLAKINAQHCIQTKRGEGYGMFQPESKGKLTMGKSFHYKMMDELDGATYRGRSIPPQVHYAVRQSLREANMHGKVIASSKQLAKATLDRLAKESR